MPESKHGESKLVYNRVGVAINRMKRNHVETEDKLDAILSQQASIMEDIIKIQKDIRIIEIKTGIL